MASRGWEHVRESDLRKMGVQPAAAKSKYRNVRIEIDGEKFDSKREASRWQELRALQHAGVISDLKRQIRMPLYAPQRVRDGVILSTGAHIVVSEYIADFVYLRDGALIVEDAKGHRTAVYQLKKKHLFLQDGIEIQEV